MGSQRADGAEERLSRLAAVAEAISQQRQKTERMALRVDGIEADLASVASEANNFVRTRRPLRNWELRLRPCKTIFRH
jgi:hypothetical protein